MADPEVADAHGDDADEIARKFHEIYYARRIWCTTTWLEAPLLKCPFDLWAYQEIVSRNRPDVIIETGTWHGGSAHFLACMCELVGNGRVITIDLASGPQLPENPMQPQHDRLSYLTGSSIVPETMAAVAEMIQPEEKTMVILDSHHHRDHVLSELRGYSPLVTEGQYLIVEDTNLNGNPVFPDFGPGPAEAVRLFLADRDDFIVDTSVEKHLMTFNPGGFLKRVKAS